jgi:heat shock protein HslJ
VTRITTLTTLTTLAAAAIAACLLFACATTSPREQAPTATPEGDWTLTAIRGEPLAQVIPEGARTPTLAVTAEGRIAGHAGINQYSGAVDPDTWPHGGFNPGPIIATRMGGAPAAMNFEMDYLGALDEVTGFAVRAGELELSAGDGALLRFEPAKPLTPAARTFGQPLPSISRRTRFGSFPFTRLVTPA